jgi:DNA-directed RNA polymerase specialized sigma24 family protein
MEVHMPIVADRAKLEDLMHRFARGDHGIAREFHQIARPLLVKFANRFGWFLAEDKREEVVQQALVLLRGPAGQTFDRGRGAPEVFLRLITRRAAREVGATYALPGTRTRPSKHSRSDNVPAAARIVSLEDLPEHETPSVEGPERVVEIQHDVAATLAAAPTDVANALRRIYLQDIPVTRVAAEMEISRYTLDRKIDKFVETFADQRLGPEPRG